MDTKVRSRIARLALPLLALPALWGCSDDGTTGPVDGQFSREITVSELGDAVASGSTRLEIELRGGTLVAEEVEVEEAERLDERESVEARVTALELDGAAGTLVLALGELRVDFSGTAEFRDETDDGEEPLTFAEFVARVQAALGAGFQPRVEAKREPAGEPQDPADATFVATRLELDDEDDDDGPEIEINVDGDNFEENDSPPPDAWIRVLGLEIELRASDGTTELEAKEADERDEFEGIVQSVDVDASTFTLVDGTVVRLVADTEIEADDDESIPSLAEVGSALVAGQTVEAEGDGVVVSESPLTLEAIEVEFELEDDSDDDD